MKKIFVFFLVAYASCAHSGNTILAIVNKTPITLSSIQNKLNDSNSKEEQIIIISDYIDKTLQVQKASELELTPTNRDIEKVLIDVAQSNDLSLKELMNFEDFYLVEKDIFEKLSILNLQRFITKDLKASEEEIHKACSNNNSTKDQKQIKIAQIIISEIDAQINDLEEENLIIIFLDKLASHIKKGASFETFAKLHSQHPSYQNGGITNWLPVKGPILEMLDFLDDNEVSKVYATDFGLAIAIKIDERFINSKLEECKEQIIYNNAESHYSEWLKKLREEANIETYYEKLL